MSSNGFWITTKTAAKRRQQQEIQVQIHLRPDQSQFRALCWRHITRYGSYASKHGSYCILVGKGFLPLRSIHTHEGLYPLVDWAVEHDDIELFHRLQADPIGMKMCTTSALKHAVAHGRLEIVQWLLENQFDNNQGVGIVLEEAAQQRQVKILDWLYTRFKVVRSLATVERIADNARDVTIAQWISSHYREVATPSARAIAEVIRSGNLEMFLHITDAHGISVLSPQVQYFAQVAAHSGHHEIVRWIAEAHPEEDVTPMTVLNAAIRGGHLAIVRWCIEELHSWDPFGLDHAMAQGRLDVLEFLHTTARQRATTKTVPVEGEIHFLRASSQLKGISRRKDGEVTARWVLQNVHSRDD